MDRMAGDVAPPEPLTVRTYGAQGPTVVVLHGGPGAPGFAASLCRLMAPWYRVLEPLQRRADATGLTVERHICDLAAIAPERATVVGHSWGAMLGLSYAAKHPERVGRLVLIGCGSYDLASRAGYQDAMRERLGPVGLEAIARLERAMDAAEDPEAKDRIFGQIGALAQAAQSFDLLPDDDPSPLAADHRGHRQTWDDVKARQRAGLEPASFRAIRCPVSMLHGADDPHPGRATFDTLRRFIPQLRYAEFARCGHEPWRERHAKDAFLDTLRQAV